MKERSRPFFTASLLLCLLAGGLVVACNVTVDIFGVFRNPCGRELVIFGEERFSKKMLSYRYIPNCFDGVLLGPSLSANLDTKGLSHGKIYNLSLMGGRVNQFDPYLDALLDNPTGKLKKAIICLHPYFTNLSPETLVTPEKKEGLGSVPLLRTYLFGMVRHFELWPNKYPKAQFNSHGHNAYEAFFRVDNLQVHVENHAKKDEPLFSNNCQAGIEALKDMLIRLDDHGIQVFLYHHPVPYPIYLANKDQFTAYQNDIDNTLGTLLPTIPILNLNHTGNQPFMEDLSNFIDHGHLSPKGQKEVLEKLNQAMAGDIH